MSHQVLARKWRPQIFSDIVGQEHVVRALVNALTANRLHHAYLFSGTRGVGKTTIARILAKALNCEQGISAEPCGQCASCLEIAEGRSVDLIEVDAASRTRVEDTRELLDNVQYAPTQARFKVYLIDEVHMLSGHSFNALLKTLEEPPEHVKFLLATTDPQKLPVTILSRCLQFNLTHLSVEQISAQLQVILQQEKVPVDEVSAQLIAGAADGSMRDALSLLDQALAFSGNDLNEQNISQMLGMAPRQHFHSLVSSVVQCQAKEVLQIVEQLAQFNVNYVGVLEEMGAVFHQAALLQKVPELDRHGIHHAELVAMVADHLSAEDIQLHYQFVLRGVQDIKHTHTARAGFEMVVLRMMLFRPDAGHAQTQDNEKSARSSATVSPEQTENTAPIEKKKKIASASVNDLQQRWEQIVSEINATGVAYALAQHASLKSIEGNRVQLELAAEHKSFMTQNALKKLQQQLCESLQTEVKLDVEVVQNLSQLAPAVKKQVDQEMQVEIARRSLMDDEFVRGLQKEMQAELIPDSIKTNEK